MNYQSVLMLVIGAAICAPVHGQDKSTLEVNAYGKIIQPFIEKHCVGCHGADSPAADFSLHELVGGSQFPKDAKRWERVLEMLASRQMPPRDTML